MGYQHITAITLNDEDAEAARKRGIDCSKMDMTFLGFEDKIFDALWVRHALEHSPFAYLMKLRPVGYLDDPLSEKGVEVHSIKQNHNSQQR